MITLNDLKSSLCIDIETCRQYKTLEELKSVSESLYHIWIKQSRKHKTVNPTFTEEEIYQTYAGLHPEFAKIIAFSVGYFTTSDDGVLVANVKAKASEDELDLLKGINSAISWYTAKVSKLQLLGYNVRDFDTPFIVSRMMYNGIKPEKVFQTYVESKPWDSPIIDLIQMLRMSRNEYISLETACISMGVETSKDDIIASEIGSYYYDDKIDMATKLERIKIYCGKDVKSTMLLADKIRTVWGN